MCSSNIHKCHTQCFIIFLQTQRSSSIRKMDKNMQLHSEKHLIHNNVFFNRNYSSEAPENNIDSNIDISQLNLLGNCRSTTEDLLLNIYQVMLSFKDNKTQKADNDRCCSEWMLIATVLDRLLLITFTIITIVISATILTNHPEYNDEETLASIE